MLPENAFYNGFMSLVCNEHNEIGDANGVIPRENEVNVPAANNGDGVINEEKEERSVKLDFIVKQMDLLPEENQRFMLNMVRSFPTSPLFLFLVIGTMGTCVARYSAVQRPDGHVSNVTRTGAFYNLIAPSRFGKGIAMRVLRQLARVVEKTRSTQHEQ